MRVNVLWIAIALLAGLVMGGWGPRLDLKQAREDLKSMQSGKAKAANRPAELAGLRAMLRLPEGEQRTGRRAATNAPPSTGRDQTAQAATQSVAQATATTNPPIRLADRKEELRNASELWLTRVALARNSFVSNAQLDKEQEKKFDVLTESMNMRLGDRVDKWVEVLKAKGAVQPEDGLRMVNDLSSVLVLTYDEMDRTMPPDWRQRAGENFQLVNFIDPEAVMPLVELENIVTPRSHMSGPPHPRQANP